MNRTEIIALELELEGYAPGSPEFDVAFRSRRIEKCQEHRGVGNCQECLETMFCRLIEEHKRAAL